LEEDLAKKNASLAGLEVSFNLKNEEANSYMKRMNNLEEKLLENSKRYEEELEYSKNKINEILKDKTEKNSQLQDEIPVLFIKLKAIN